MYEVTNHQIQKAGRFSVVVDQISDGADTFTYSYVDIKPGVVILPLIGNQIYAIRQFRHPVRRWALELPAGQIEEGETPEEAARRELLEETGCEIIRMIPLGETYASIGCTSELVRLFAAECKEGSMRHLDRSERIETCKMSVEAFEEAVGNGELLCATNELAWRRYKRWLDEGLKTS